MNNAYEQTKRILIEQAGDRVYSSGDSYASMWGKIVENEGLKLDALSRVSLMTTWKAWLNHLGGSASALESPNRVLGKILTALGGTPSVMEIEGSLIRKIREAMGNGPGPDPSFVPISATGGTVEDVEIEGISYRVHTFTTSGDFVVSDTGSEGLVDALIVGGGGGGGGFSSFNIGGGGGAGEFVESFGVIVETTSYPVVVGGGGAGGASTVGGLGSASEAFEVVGIGGGGGGYGPTAPSQGAYGAGGGATRDEIVISGSVGQINHRGGDGIGNSSSELRFTGGGGGSGGNGGDGTDLEQAPGGQGTASPIFAVVSPIAGGGGGTRRITGGDTGGLGQAGGGNGGNPPQNATQNTGSGGGGDGGNGTGGNGGSGIVKIRYPLEVAS